MYPSSGNYQGKSTTKRKRMFTRLKTLIVEKLYHLLETYREKQFHSSVRKIQFKSIGPQFTIGKDYRISNPQCIEIGNNFFAMNRLRLDAITNFNGDNFTPEVKIGENVTLNNDVHIGCIDKIEIGDHCLLASRIYISDHNHGDLSKESLLLPPNKRPLVSKGPVIIKNNVWIGEGAAILGNVTVGENAIIATNAVVTKDVPANCIVAGIPAKVIKTLNS